MNLFCGIYRSGNDNDKKIEMSIRKVFRFRLSEKLNNREKVSRAPE